MYILLVTYNVYPTTDNFGIKGRECNPLPHTSIYSLYICIHICGSSVWSSYVINYCFNIYTVKTKKNKSYIN